MIIEAPPHALIFGEVGARLLVMGERDKAYELFTLAGSFALSKTLDNPAPIMRENN